MADIEKVLENDIYNLNLYFAGNSNPLECFSNLWESLVKRNIKSKKIIGTDKGTFYYMQLYSDKGKDYIGEQLRILGGQL